MVELDERDGPGAPAWPVAFRRSRSAAEPAPAAWAVAEPAPVAWDAAESAPTAGRADADLVDELCDHRPEALDHLLAAHGREIQAVANMITRDRDEAADVLEDTLCIAWEKARQLHDHAALRPWLLRIATNRALSRRRVQARLVVLDSIPDPAVPDPTGPSATRLALLAGMASLAPRERAAVALHYYADLPVDAVAQAMGTSPNTVKTQLREALAKLRLALDDGSAGGGRREVGHA